MRFIVGDAIWVSIRGRAGSKHLVEWIAVCEGRQCAPPCAANRVTRWVLIATSTMTDMSRLVLTMAAIHAPTMGAIRAPMMGAICAPDANYSTIFGQTPTGPNSNPNPNPNPIADTNPNSNPNPSSNPNSNPSSNPNLTLTRTQTLT